MGYILKPFTTITLQASANSRKRLIRRTEPQYISNRNLRLREISFCHQILRKYNSCFVTNSVLELLTNSSSFVILCACAFHSYLAYFPFSNIYFSRNISPAHTNIFIQKGFNYALNSEYLSSFYM